MGKVLFEFRNVVIAVIEHYITRLLFPTFVTTPNLDSQSTTVPSPHGLPLSRHHPDILDEGIALQFR